MVDALLWGGSAARRGSSSLLLFTSRLESAYDKILMQRLESQELRSSGFPLTDRVLDLSSSTKRWMMPESRFFCLYAEIAQLVEHNLAKVGVASSSLVFRSYWKFAQLTRQNGQAHTWKPEKRISSRKKIVLALTISKRKILLGLL